MPRTVTRVDDLQVYLHGVLERADHHAGQVGEIALAIAGAVVWRKSGPIRAYERGGKMTNAIWFDIGDNRFALSYDHKSETIRLRRDSLRGPIVAAFDNRSSIADVKSQFAAL